jgi:hypothetical protein
VLAAGWFATWFVRRPLRRLWYFPSAIGLMLLVVAGIALRPHHPCQESGLACADDYSFFAVGNLLFGFWTWLALLVVTGLVEAGRAIASGLRPAKSGDDSRGADQQAAVGGTRATGPDAIELPDRGDPARGVP